MGFQRNLKSESAMLIFRDKDQCQLSVKLKMVDQVSRGQEV